MKDNGDLLEKLRKQIIESDWTKAFEECEEKDNENKLNEGEKENVER